MGDGPTLDQVLLALQKSFSRVSAATARATEGEGEPRSIITGPIDFEMTVTGDVASGDDHIRVHDTGALTLKIRGSIQHDIVVEATDSGESGAARSTSTDPTDIVLPYENPLFRYRGGLFWYPGGRRRGGRRGISYPLPYRDPDEVDSVSADQPDGEERRATHEGETEGA
jgi:hypothetical protein